MIDRISGGIDWIIEKQGTIASLLIIPLLFVVVYEVFMRYGFNKPTIWGFEVTMFIYGMHYMFGLSYMDHYDGHVKVDVFVTRLPLKTQLMIKIFNHLIISLPVLLGILIWTTFFGITSTGYMEKNWTSWAPYIWPYKDLMALGFLFLFIQDISNLFKTIRQLKSIKKEGE